jgi:very-short-patch-repair endonuclease
MANEQARRLRKSMTPQEVKLWMHLRTWREQGHYFRRQAPREGYIVDFVCLKRHLVVEVDGGQHGFHRRALSDAERDRRLHKRHGFKVLRFWNSEVDRNLHGVLETILAALLERPASPPTDLRSVPPPRSGEG